MEVVTSEGFRDPVEFQRGIEIEAASALKTEVAQQDKSLPEKGLTGFTSPLKKPLGFT